MTIQEQMENESVAELLCSQVPLIGPETSVGDAVLAMQQADVSTALVCEGQTLTGIFTERDLMKYLGSGHEKLDAPVRFVMTASPTTLSAAAAASDAFDLMCGHHYRNIPVVDDDGKALGIIRMVDILRFIAESLPASVLNLPPDNQAISLQEGA